MTTTIEYGYDRHVQSWCVMVLDEKRNEITSSYVGNLHDAKVEIEYFKEEYKPATVTKIKAY